MQAGALSALKEHEDRFAGVDEDLGAALEKLGRGLEDYGTKLEQFVRSVDSQCGKAVTHLAGAIHELEEVVEAIGEKKNG